MKPRVYLAGPIKGLHYDEATNWREYAASELAPEIDSFSPMRGKNFLRSKGIILDNSMNHVLHSQRAIMVRDHHDCIKADVLLVNLLGAKAMSLGTGMEFAWAYDRSIPVVCAMEQYGNPNDHPMIREAIDFQVETLDEAIMIVKSILLPGIPETDDSETVTVRMPDGKPLTFDCKKSK